MLFIPPCLNIDKNLCYTKLSLQIKNYIDLNRTTSLQKQYLNHI